MKKVKIFGMKTEEIQPTNSHCITIDHHPEISQAIVYSGATSYGDLKIIQESMVIMEIRNNTALNNNPFEVESVSSYYCFTKELQDIVDLLVESSGREASEYKRMYTLAIDNVYKYRGSISNFNELSWYKKLWFVITGRTL